MDDFWILISLDHMMIRIGKDKEWVKEEEKSSNDWNGE